MITWLKSMAARYECSTSSMITTKHNAEKESHRAQQISFKNWKDVGPELQFLSEILFMKLILISRFHFSDRTNKMKRNVCDTEQIKNIEIESNSNPQAIFIFSLNTTITSNEILMKLNLWIKINHNEVCVRLGKTIRVIYCAAKNHYFQFVAKLKYFIQFSPIASRRKCSCDYKEYHANFD